MPSSTCRKFEEFFIGQLILKRALTSRPSGEWTDDDYDVFAEGGVVGRIFKVHAAPVGVPWMWALAFGYQAAMTAFARVGGRE
jgi:hypothetical protein